MVSEDKMEIPAEQEEAAEREQKAGTWGEAPSEAAELDRLKAELGDQTAKANEYLDQWKRAAADFSNYRKRQAREQEQMTRWATANLLQDLLPIMDDLQLALDRLDDKEQGTGWAQGVRLVEQKLAATLAKAGLDEIPAEPGMAFDPTVHEAIFFEESDEHPDGSVLEVVRRGYKIGDRVLRPTMVKVAKAS